MNDHRRDAQVMIETIAAFMLILLLFIGTTKVFVWMAADLAIRSEAYQSQRNVTGAKSSEVLAYNDSARLPADFIPRLQ